MRCIHPEDAGVSFSHLSASYTPEGGSEVLMKVALILIGLVSSVGDFSFFYLGFLSRTFRNDRTEGEGEGHFFNSTLALPPASQTLDISRAITAENSPLHIDLRTLTYTPPEFLQIMKSETYFSLFKRVSTFHYSHFRRYRILK